MGYLYMLCVALMFSFGGTCVKLTKPFFSPEYITLFRFVVGIGFLLIMKVFQKKKLDFRLLGFWILFGGLAKFIAYFTENYALSHGPSYGNIVTQPTQTVFITLSSLFLFKEKLPPKKLFCIFLCITGVLLISWNGRSLEEFMQGNLALLLLFVVSGIGAGGHVLAQKMLNGKMDVIDSNLSMFSISAILSLIPVFANGEVYGTPDLPAILALLFFGMITGVGFYLNAKAISMIPFYMVPIVQNVMVLFAILWGVLFFQEQITWYIVAGTVIFISGIIGINLVKAK